MKVQLGDESMLRTDPAEWWRVYAESLHWTQYDGCLTAHTVVLSDVRTLRPQE